MFFNNLPDFTQEEIVCRVTSKAFPASVIVAYSTVSPGSIFWTKTGNFLTAIPIDNWSALAVLDVIIYVFLSNSPVPPHPPPSPSSLLPPPSWQEGGGRREEGGPPRREGGSPGGKEGWGEINSSQEPGRGGGDKLLGGRVFILIFKFIEK